MLRSPRYWPGAAVAAALFAAPAARAAEPDKLLPEEAEAVISVNVRQLFDSEIIKKYALEQLKQWSQGKDVEKVLRDMGLDPFKDIDRVTVAVWGKQPEMKALVVVRGKFDAEKLYKTAVAQTKLDPDKFSLVRDGDEKMFKFQPETGNPVYATVVNEGAVVLGSDKVTLKAALTAADGGKKPAINKDLSGLIGKMDDKSTIWIAAVMKDRLNGVKLPGPAAPLQNQFPNLDTMTVVAKVTNDVRLEVGLGMKDEDSAKEMGKVMKEMLDLVKGFAPLAAANDPKMKPLADAAKTLDSTVRERTVLITGRLTGDAIGQMLKGGGD